MTPAYQVFQLLGDGCRLRFQHMYGMPGRHYMIHGKLDQQWLYRHA